jgi:hypothetical protein
MNQSQRKFLIDKLKEKERAKISELERGKIAYPSASNYIFRAVLNGTIEIADKKTILKALTERALKAKEGENWLEPDHRQWTREKERDVKLSITDLIKVPKEYADEAKKVEEHNGKINAQIETLKKQVETLIIRIQIASDKTLQKMINEVDDMGDISLIDTKIKLLN